MEVNVFTPSKKMAQSGWRESHKIIELKDVANPKCNPKEMYHTHLCQFMSPLCLQQDA